MQHIAIPAHLRYLLTDQTVLAMGAEMKSSFSLLHNGEIISSPAFGDTSDLNHFSDFKDALEGFLSKNRIKPDIILSDLHPAYSVSLYAQELSTSLGCTLIKVQHHLAHAYSVAFEHQLTNFSSIVCDGLGYGEDGTLWGGEVFHNSSHLGHLEKHKQLGSDSATIHPTKMLFSILLSFMSFNEATVHMGRWHTEKELHILHKQFQTGYNAPLTSSTGRVLDAASVFLGLCEKREYEGSPAILLDTHATEPYSLEPLIKNNVLSTSHLFRFLVDNKEKDKRRLAATVLTYIAEGLYEMAKQQGTPIAFSGGCAHSRIMKQTLSEKGVLLNKNVSCDDLGISVGQIAYCLANPRN